MTRTPPAPAGLLTDDNVARLLALLGTGKENAKTSDEIQRALGLRRQRTNEATRALVAYAVNVRHHLILSGARGFWKAGSKEEVVEALESLRGRQIGLDQRIQSLRMAWLIRHGDDL